MPKRILVTGATGYLGGHILAAVAAQGDVPIAAARDASRLPASFDGETRVGDLRDPAYRAEVVRGVDAIAHAGTWSSFWGHEHEERELFLDPTLDLIDRAVAAGVGRFIASSTVALSSPSRHGRAIEDDAPARAFAAWPHHSAMVAVEDRMRVVGSARTRMVSLRLGHFVGAGASTALVPAIIPRLRTRQVPWVDHGRARLPLVSGADMGRAFALAAVADGLGEFESINIVGAEQPTAREVFTLVAKEAGVPTPLFSVPVRVAYGFGRAMEALHPLLPGKAPFLTRALVFVGEDWYMASDKAKRLLGYEPATDWRDAVRASVEERRAGGFAWPALAQAGREAERELGRVRAYL